MPVPLLKLCPPAEIGITDTILLQQFITNRDQSAFTELVRRHGPLVYRVCHRLAPTLADDAFQAVFLTLACRSGSIRRPAAVGSWLVGVAGRIARQMRIAERRRIEREQAASHSECSPTSPDHSDLAAALDDELSRLPDQLRDPVVLCLVRGRTHDQAAAELGGSVRTLRRRLDRARAVLQARLERRGVVPLVATALIAGVSTPTFATSPMLVRKTISIVFQFLDGGTVAPSFIAKGVTGSMAKIKASALVATVSAVLVCLGISWSNEDPPNNLLNPPPVSTAEDHSRLPRGNLVPTAMDQPAEKEPSFRGSNFVVHAPTEMMARIIAAEAEYHRRTLALKWLGQELPRWEKPCLIRFMHAHNGNGGTSTFTFGKNNAGEQTILSAAIELRGDFMQTLTTTLPHEVMHTVLASHFGQQLPRWADEGIALLAESDEEQFSHEVRVRELLNAGRGIRLRVLLRMTEYPRDLIVLYSQGHSLIRFLAKQPAPIGVPVFKDVPYLERLFQVVRNDRYRHLLAFLKLGMQDNTLDSWNKAANAIYGFKSIDDLEEAWLASLKDPPVSKPAPKKSPNRLQNDKPLGENLIPPANLPTQR